jgi:integrase
MTSDKGRLRLQWRYEGKQYYLYLLLDDTKVNRLKAKDIQLLIEADIETGCLDTTLAKYKPHKATGKQLSDLTCSELFDDWLKYKTAYCDKRTIEYYKGVKRRLVQYFANKRSRDITKKDTLGFFAWLKTKDICGETFQRRLESLTACWNWAIENGYLTDNPWIGLSKLVKVPSKPKPKPFTLDEINRIINGFNNHPRYSQLTLFIKFLFGTGSRTGEAINDINLVRRVWKPVLDQQGIPYRYLYNTRHTFISHCLEKGMNPVVIAQITGHDVNVLFNHYAGSLHTQPSVPDIVIG